MYHFSRVTPSRYAPFALMTMCADQTSCVRAGEMGLAGG